MANELVRGAGRAIATKGVSAIKKSAKKVAKKAAKHAAKKHAAKKHAKKATKHVADKVSRDARPSGDELKKAFHHLQRATAVVSLLEADSGGDLKDLLQQGVAHYLAASAGEKKQAQVAASLLRAAEHLAMAGLYAARGLRSNKIEEPETDDIEQLGWSIGSRLREVRAESKFGLRLHAMVFELVKRAEASEDDSHLAWELVHGADALCVALEAGAGRE